MRNLNLVWDDHLEKQRVKLVGRWLPKWEEICSLATSIQKLHLAVASSLPLEVQGRRDHEGLQPTSYITWMIRCTGWTAECSLPGTQGKYWWKLKSHLEMNIFTYLYYIFFILRLNITFIYSILFLVFAVVLVYVFSHLFVLPPVSEMMGSSLSGGE